MGIVRSDIQGTLPWSRAEFGRLLVEAEMRAPAARKEVGDAYEPYLRRLRREFADEVSVSGGRVLASPYSTFVKPVDDFRLRAVGGSIETRRGLSRIGATAEGTPLLHNQEGALATESWTLLADGSTVGRLWGGFAFAVHPLAALRDSGDLGDLPRRDGLRDTADVRLHKGYVKLGLADTEIEFGRDSLWWGPARRTSLILSNEAPPLEMLKLSNPEPILLPWVLRYLGLLKGTLFVARLDLQRTTSTLQLYDRLNPYMVGMRVQLKPLPWLELGLARTIVLRTERSNGRNLSASDILRIVIGTNIAGKDDTSNQLAGFDGLVRLPFLRNTELYVQAIGEDEASGLPSKYSFTGGLYVPRITSDGAVDLRVEATMTHELYGLSAVFREGYGYRGLALGSPAGSDAFEIWGRTSWDATPEITFALEGQYWERAVPAEFTGPVAGTGDETSFGGKAEVSWWATEWLQGIAEVGAEQVENFNFQDGRSRTNVIGGVSLRLDF